MLKRSLLRTLQVMEHIAAAEDMFNGNVAQNVMKAPVRPAAEDVPAIDAMVVAMNPRPVSQSTGPSAVGTDKSVRFARSGIKALPGKPATD